MAQSKFAAVVLIFALTMAFMGPISAVLFSAAAEAAIIRHIEVRGNQRVDAGLIRDSVGVRRGMDFAGVDIDHATKRLFAMGLFSDVMIQQIDNALVINVTEYKVINQVIFQGNKKIKDIDLQRVIALKPHESVDPAKRIADEQTIRDTYVHIGHHGVTVSARIEDLDQQRVNVIFEIDEGKKTKIGNILFKGNKIFSTLRLRDVMTTKSTNVFSWLTQDDVYNANRVAADEEALRRFYHSHGYADFRVLSSDAVLDPSTNQYTITFIVHEGHLYRLGDIEIESTIPGIHARSVGNVLKTRRGDIYNIRKVEASVRALNDCVADSGYAFAKIESLGNRDFTNHTISVTYTVDEGPRTYVERIEIRGNSKTRDQVIRREFDLGEGDAFNQTMVKRAKHRLEGLGFFQSINISTAPGSESDQVILVVDVVEKSTGEFSVGGGYATGGETPGISVETSITERNFLGRGQYLRLGIGLGQQESRNYSLSLTEPHLLGYRLSSGFDLFHRTYRMNDDWYDVTQTGGTIRFGVPIADELTGNLAYNYIEEEYDLGRQQPNDSYPGAIIEAAQNSPWRRSSVSYSLVYNSIDNMQNPHAGLFAHAMQEYAGLGGNAQFLKTSGRAMLYKTLSERYDLIGLLRLGSGYVHEIGEGGTRIFDMFRSNVDMIRGFRFNGIGPMQRSSNGHEYFLGGNTYMHATAEVQFPMPVVPDSLGMHGAVFIDTATLYGNNYNPSHSDEGQVVSTESIWRTATGVSMIWTSPLGPLRFDYAWPLRRADGDQVQNFYFGISSKF